MDTESHQHPEPPHPRPEEIRFEVDAEPLETTEPELTPVQIMNLAGIDPANHYLSEIEGHQQHSFKDTPNISIRIRQGARFVSASTGPTPTS